MHLAPFLAAATAAAGLFVLPSAARADEAARAFPTVAALCAAWGETTAARRPELEESARVAGVALTRPTCHRWGKPLGVPFTGDDAYKRPFFLERSDGFLTRRDLVVETPRGWTATAIGWETVDPFDPGCPGVPTITGLAELRVENGYLVAVLDQEVGTVDEAGNEGSRKVQTTAWCRQSADGLECAPPGTPLPTLP